LADGGLRQMQDACRLGQAAKFCGSGKGAKLTRRRQVHGHNITIMRRIRNFFFSRDPAWMSMAAVCTASEGADDTGGNHE
jgi:hypothetical protein